MVTQLQLHNRNITGIDYSLELLLHAHRELNDDLLIRAECEKSRWSIPRQEVLTSIKKIRLIFK